MFLRFRFFLVCVVIFFAALTSRAADVGAYTVAKQQYFQQTNASSPIALATNGWAFQCAIFAGTTNVITNASVTLPSLVVKNLAYEDPYTWRYKQLFNSQSSLDAAYPASGNYSVKMQTIHDGTHTVSLAFGSTPTYTYPAVTPQISNWTNAQQIDSALPFTLQWNNLGGNANDIVSLYIGYDATNGIFYSPSSGSPGALTGTNISIVIPAYTLPQGTNLFGLLLIVTAGGNQDYFSYIGAVGSPGYAKATVFNLTTRAFLRPTLTLLARTGTTNILKLTGESNRIYQIETTTNNLFTNWTSLVTNTLTGTNNQFRYTNTSSQVRRFYRGKVGP